MSETAAQDLPVLYHYWRSSSAWRVRWGLAHKGIDYQAVTIDLLQGEQRSAAHLARNPLGTVPVLFIDGIYLAESMAILEYLEETRKASPLLPPEPRARARVRQLAQIIVADTQPLQNLSVLEQVERLTGDADLRRKWAADHIAKGLDAYEAILQAPSRPKGPYSYGETPTLADLCLIPQCYNARRQGLELSRWPCIAAVEAAGLATLAGQRSHPDAYKPA